MNWILIFITVIATLYFVIKLFVEYRQSNSIDEKALIWIIGIVIFFPILIFYLDYYDVPSKIGWLKTLNSTQWLNVIFIYSAGIISAMIGAFMTIKAVKLSIEEQEKVRISENKKIVLPLLKVSPAEEYDYRYKYLQFDCLFTEESKHRNRKDITDTATVTIKIENVGMRELYDLYIGNFQSHVFKENSEYHRMYPVIYKDDYVFINLFFYEMGSYDVDEDNDKHHTMISPIMFNCYFKDCYNNWYCQTLQISLMYQLMEGIELEERALNISVSNAEIISPPIELHEKDLPWENGKSLSHHI